MYELPVNSAFLHIPIFILYCATIVAYSWYVLKRNLSFYGMQLHHQVPVRATRVKMEERVFLRALVSFALVQMNTPGKDVNNVCMLR